MESQGLVIGSGKGKRYKEEEGLVPTSPSRPQRDPKHVARAPNRPR